MTDRELLELAAKAAGVELAPGTKRLVNVPGIAIWNPLEDDGDALRLAVELHIELRFGRHAVMAHQGFTWAHAEGYGSDPAEATRRAIVRAAAELAKGKQ